jgi:hypothetical protein
MSSRALVAADSIASAGMGVPVSLGRSRRFVSQPKPALASPRRKPTAVHSWKRRALIGLKAEIEIAAWRWSVRMRAASGMTTSQLPSITCRSVRPERRISPVSPFRRLNRSASLSRRSSTASGRPSTSREVNRNSTSALSLPLIRVALPFPVVFSGINHNESVSQ